MKLKKCAWFTTSVRYLGHIIRPGQLCINEAMSKSLKEAQHPTSQTELRSFLGLCNVYRRFVKDFSRRAAPLNDLLRKGQPAKLGPLTSEQAAAFKDLVEAVTSPPVLALPRSDGKTYRSRLTRMPANASLAPSCFRPTLMGIGSPLAIGPVL